VIDKWRRAEKKDVFRHIRADGNLAVEQNLYTPCRVFYPIFSYVILRPLERRIEIMLIVWRNLE